MDVMKWTVNETLIAAPALVAAFNGLGLDTCCGGALTLREAARAAGVSPDELRRLVEPALKAAGR